MDLHTNEILQLSVTKDIQLDFNNEFSNGLRMMAIVFQKWIHNITTNGIFEYDLHAIDIFLMEYE